MTVSPFPPLCVCRENLATVEFRTDAGAERVCKRCAAMLQMMMRLMGTKATRRPVLSIIRGGTVTHDTLSRLEVLMATEVAPPRGNIARTQFFEAVADELEHAYAKHGAAPWGRHEFFAILQEEVEDLWDDIKADAPTVDLYKEAVQVVAMCVRYFETDDRYRGWHWGSATPDARSVALPEGKGG